MYMGIYMYTQYIWYMELTFSVMQKDFKQAIRSFGEEKNGRLGLPQELQKQVIDLQRNVLTSLIHFVQFYS